MCLAGDVLYLAADPEQGGVFPDALLEQRVPNLASQRRTHSRGLLLLSSLIRELPPLPAQTGVYLSCGHGPVHERTQALALAAPPGQRVAAMERGLPPKDYFISNPSIKAAHISIEFGLHGPWMVFQSPRLGMAQALQAASMDVADQEVECALVAGMFMLDEPLQLDEYRQWGAPLAEAVFVLVARARQDLAEWAEIHDAWGVYGPLTPYLERIQHGRNT